MHHPLAQLLHYWREAFKATWITSRNPKNVSFLFLLTNYPHLTEKNLAGSSAKMLFKVVFTNYVDKFLAFLNHLPPTLQWNFVLHQRWQYFFFCSRIGKIFWKLVSVTKSAAMSTDIILHIPTYCSDIVSIL